MILEMKVTFFHYLDFRTQKQLIVMKMDIIQFIIVIDTDLIIQIKNGIKKKLNIC